MALELSQIKDILKKSRHEAIIQRAMLIQNHLRFHTEPAVSIFANPANVPYISRSVNVFLDWVRTLLPEDKYNVFLSLFRFPLPSSALVDSIYRELKRVFNSRNSSSSYQFKDSELLDDWLAYKKEVLKEPDIWKQEGWSKMQISPNSILVVDLPQQQEGARPAPYFYWLEFNKKVIIDYEVKDNHIDFEWLIFRQPQDRIAVFDDTSIRVFQLDGKGAIQSMVIESKHDLGYCPARFFWSDFLTNSEKDVKKNPITKELANLDWYLFFAISKRHLDLYAPYPIYSAYEAECDFENNATGEYCDGGFLRDSNDQYQILADGSLKTCPRCSQKRIVGPGSFLEVPVPDKLEGTVDMRNPIQITTIDSDSLEYNVKECQRLKDEILISVVGSGGKVSEKEAINETQVAANFESKTAVLNDLKHNLEGAEKFVNDTVCRLRYGDGFIGSAINWGTEFYVATVAELYAKYKQAKTNGASDAELDAIAQQILEVEYRNNPIILQRMQILRQLEPYPHKTLDEVLKLYEKQLVDDTTLRIKINFTSYIDRFERENINIVEFASNLSTKDKIDIINNKLKDYANERTTTN